MPRARNHCGACGVLREDMLWASFIPERLENALEPCKTQKCQKCANKELDALYDKAEAPCFGMYFGCPNVATLKMHYDRTVLPGCPEWTESVYVCGRCYQRARFATLRKQALDEGSEEPNDTDTEEPPTTTPPKRRKSHRSELKLQCKNASLGCSYVKEVGVAIQGLGIHERMCPFNVAERGESSEREEDEEEEEEEEEEEGVAPSKNLVNKRDQDGMTALHQAVRKNHVSCLEVLLKMRSVDRGVRDNRGRTALDIAKMKGFRVCVKMLQKK